MRSNQCLPVLAIHPRGVTITVICKFPFPISYNFPQQDKLGEKGLAKASSKKSMATDVTIPTLPIPVTLDGRDEEEIHIHSSNSSEPGSDSEGSQLLIGESLIPVRERKLPGTTVVTLDGLLTEPLLLKEDLKQGCGGQLWPAGLLLSKYMLEEHATDLVGKTMFVHPIHNIII